MRAARQYLSPIATQGRLITCTKCGALVDVVEIPAATIDPRQYACPDHWQPLTTARESLPQPPRRTAA